MRKLLGLAVVGLLAFVMVVGLAGTARADIIFTLGNHPQSDESNILFGSPQTGATITGEVEHTGIAVVFSSLTNQTLVQSAQGQADITGITGAGETAQDVNLTSMQVTVPGYTFLDFILNLQNGTGTAQVVVTDNVGQPFTYALGNGQNYLTITTANGESISEIQVTMLGGGSWDDFKQPRISGVSAVPEPASMLLLGTGLLGAGFFGRRKKKN